MSDFFLLCIFFGNSLVKFLFSISINKIQISVQLTGVSRNFPESKSREIKCFFYPYSWDSRFFKPAKQVRIMKNGISTMRIPNI